MEKINKRSENSSEVLAVATGDYELYPKHPLIGGHITQGYSNLAKRLSDKPVYVLDGYIGVDWEEVISGLGEAYEKLGRTVHFTDVSKFMKPVEEINALLEPFLGGDDPIFGKKATITLRDLWDPTALQEVALNQGTDIHIVYGCGAALWHAGIPLIYVDLPKNVLQQRMKAGNVRNLGSPVFLGNKETYKRFYFVDWVLLNAHKKTLLPRIEVFIDQQTVGKPSWTEGAALSASLRQLGRSYFRVRPWFEPGVWGGQWLKNRIPQLNQEVPNYAWSFEMIVPENGLVFGDGMHALEVSFDCLMYQEGELVLGKAYDRFGDDFPIRFDFLDTFDGGNLSLQCHPTTSYIQDEFGEKFTQDETYYIVDAKEDALVYLGFQENIEPGTFRTALEESYRQKVVLPVDRYVRKFPAKKHDLFLIPNGTVHCSGKNNLVLEISATPYIFTFKMYDWLRLDLDGQPRPLNIDRAFANLNFERKGSVVEDTLISKPEVQQLDSRTRKVHLPTHPEHFYAIYRYEFEEEVVIHTAGQCHILMLVEGETIELQTASGDLGKFHYIETFAVSAASDWYSLRNRGNSMAKVIVAFVKEEACQQ